jgi:hypothetical protein
MQVTIPDAVTVTGTPAAAVSSLPRPGQCHGADHTTSLSTNIVVYPIVSESDTYNIGGIAPTATQILVGAQS